MKLSIVMPTITGREEDLGKSIVAYTRMTPVEIEWLIELDHPNCGAAWNAGVPRATGEILHMGADDIQPENDGWFGAGLSVLEDGAVPLGWVREDVAGRFGRDFCRVIFCRTEWWQNVLEAHYYSDNDWTDKMIATGHTPKVAEGFDFYHRKSMIGRDDSPGRVAQDFRAYKA